MQLGRIPFHDEQRLPPDQRSKPITPTSTGPPKPDLPSLVDSTAFFLERDKVFNSTMDQETILHFLKKYKISHPNPQKSPIMFWTMVYAGVLCGRIGSSGSRERATIWLHVHKHQNLISWSTKTGIYRFNGNKYRLNHQLMLRKPQFNDHTSRPDQSDTPRECA